MASPLKDQQMYAPPLAIFSNNTKYGIHTHTVIPVISINP